jgi:ubiquinone/menaquinone biosynthesis C-methylase UbiE
MFEGREFKILFCEGCGLGKTTPFLDESVLRSMYSSTYREEDATRFPTPLEKLIRVVREGRRRRVERFSAKGRILDVGCGRGDFLLMMRERGWECSGLELDNRVGSKSKNGVDLKSGSLYDVRFPDSYFEAVTFWHVFEHVKDPEWTLKECARVLKPGGLLVLAVPNMGSLQSRLSGRGWFHLDPPFHLYHYSAENMKKFLEKNGFEVLKVRHFSFEYNPYGFLQSIYNRMGLKTNLLYDFLRSRAPKDALSRAALAFTFVSLPVVAALSMGLSLTEAALRSGGTIEVYARKKTEQA